MGRAPKNPAESVVVSVLSSLPEPRGSSCGKGAPGTEGLAILVGQRQRHTPAYPGLPFPNHPSPLGRDDGHEKRQG